LLFVLISLFIGLHAIFICHLVMYRVAQKIACLFVVLQRDAVQKRGFKTTVDLCDTS